MSNDGRKPNKKTQDEECEKGFSSGFLEQHFYPYLINLLEEDKSVRKLILEINGAYPEETAELDSEAESKAVPSGVEHRSSPVQAMRQDNQRFADTLRQELAPELTLLQLVRADVELAEDWLGDSNAVEGRQLARVIAVAAQWDQILRLWERLASRCKDQRRPATPNERQMLGASLAIHNLIWHDKQAGLIFAEQSEDFDYRKHERGLPNGDKILGEWLPGLVNAGGQTQKKPIVET